jgi:hypothetical protein
MPIEIFDVEQRSPEWFAIRAGIPTSSMFGTVMAQGRERGTDSKSRASYMRKLAGERLTGIPMESYSNDDMDRGREQEPEILARYVFERDVEVTPCGFIRNGKKGCSPDGLVGADGMVQIKSAAPHVMIEILMDSMKGIVPKKHLPQCQGELWVAERKWTDLVIGSSPRLPLAVFRLQRDQQYINDIEVAVHWFNRELDEMVKTIERLS